MGRSQGYLEAGSTVVARKSANAPALRFEQPPHDVEAKADPTKSPTITAHLVEAFEDLRVFATRDPEAAVADVSDNVTVVRARREGNRAAVGGVLDRILEQLPENDLDRAWVADDVGQVRRDVEDQLVIGGHGGKTRCCRTQQPAKIE